MEINTPLPSVRYTQYVLIREMLYSGLEKNKLASIQIFFGKIDYKKET